MRVLVANKFWYRRGGLERVMFDEIAWLEAAGHETAHFSMTHPDNEASPWERFFVPYIELGGGAKGSDSLVAAARMFDNRVAARRFGELFEAFGPDVVHVHGIHRQMSPSILAVARRAGVPVVQTLHDYHHVCPADTLLRGGDALCMPPACGALNYAPAIVSRCHKGSLAMSALSATETFYQRVRRAYERGVARFIAPSRFMADVMTRGGWSVPNDIIPNAVPMPEHAAVGGEAFVFAGRLAPEKGAGVFLDAARAAGVRALVAGDGPLAGELKRAGGAEFLGRLGGREVEDLVAHARAVVVPSVWFENAPMSVLEAMAAGVPVIASRIGGIPEQLRDGGEGILVEPGDVDALAKAMRRLARDPELATRLGAAGRARVAREYAPEAHLDALLATYAAAGARS